jgi:cell wall-associated NlpC family hydrolase
MTPQEIEVQRQAVCDEAFTWLGTPWHHRAHLKGVGVDCAQLIVKVYANAGVISPFDTGEYPRDWHIHRHEERFLGFAQRYADEIAEEQLLPGDFLVFKIGHVFSHSAILLHWPVGIHAAINEGAVVLCDLDRDYGLISDRRKALRPKAWRDGR